MKIIKKYKPAIELTLITIAAVSIHKVFFYLFDFQEIETSFMYSIYELYSWFYIFSLLIILLLIFIKQKNINNVGYTFLLVTSIQMVFAYLLVHPIIQSTERFCKIEKTNFFLIFAVFLTIETVLTIRILNNKQ